MNQLTKHHLTSNISHLPLFLNYRNLSYLYELRQLYCRVLAN